MDEEGISRSEGKGGRGEATYGARLKSGSQLLSSVFIVCFSRPERVAHRKSRLTRTYKNVWGGMEMPAGVCAEVKCISFAPFACAKARGRSLPVSLGSSLCLSLLPESAP